MTEKNLQSSVYWFLLILLSVSCKTDSEAMDQSNAYYKLTGKTMGTYYAITCRSCSSTIKDGIDSLLIQLNNEVSTYIPESIISRFNQSESGIEYSDSEIYTSFLENLSLSKQIHGLTDGAFDPSLMPIINYYGFGYTQKDGVKTIDSITVDSLFEFVGLDKISLDIIQKRINKMEPGVQLDFSALAKGYGVDLVASFLESNNIEHYLVDIGGETKAKGVNAKGNIWTLGINTPKIDAAFTERFVILQLNNKAMATSGDYRNYYELENGEKYSHTINAMTGYPAKSDILSASVIAADCMDADAWATSFMAMGLAKSKSTVEDNKHIEALFIYNDLENKMNTWHSSGFDQYILQQ